MTHFFAMIEFTRGDVYLEKYPYPEKGSCGHDSPNRLELPNRFAIGLRETPPYFGESELQFAGPARCGPGHIGLGVAASAGDLDHR